MQRSFFIVIYSCFFSVISFAQVVETILSHPKVVDGLYCDEQGNVYTTSGGLTSGYTIGKYDPNTNQFDPNFSSGFSGPINIASFNDSILLVTNYDDNSLKSYHKNTGQVSTVATSLDGTAGLAIGPQGNAYITSFGGPPMYNGQRVFKYSPSGILTVFIDSSALFRPQGITFDHLGNLYVASMTNTNNFGRIYKVNAGDTVLQLFATVGSGIGNMAYRQKDSSIYFPSNHRIMKLDLQGNLSIYTGNFLAGYIDGNLADARFQFPLGIAFSPTEDTMYIAEANSIRRLRRIVMHQTLHIPFVEAFKYSVYPNPSTGSITIELPQKTDIKIKQVLVFDTSGKSIQSLKITEQQQLISIATLPKGIYYIRIESENEHWVKKVIVQ